MSQETKKIKKVKDQILADAPEAPAESAITANEFISNNQEIKTKYNRHLIFAFQYFCRSYFGGGYRVPESRWIEIIKEFAASGPGQYAPKR